jgi:hypothetical protein
MRLRMILGVLVEGACVLGSASLRCGLKVTSYNRVRTDIWPTPRMDVLGRWARFELWQGYGKTIRLYCVCFIVISSWFSLRLNGRVNALGGRSSVSADSGDPVSAFLMLSRHSL